MANKKYNTVDYFNHPVKNGKRMYILQKRFKNDGYAVWYKLLELLGATDGHLIDLSDEIIYDYVVEYMECGEEKMLQIFKALVGMKAIDKQPYEEKKILFSTEFVQSVSHVYANRRREMPTANDIYMKSNNPATIPTLKSGHSIVEDSIVEDSIVEDSINSKKELIHPLQKFIFEKFPKISKMKIQLTDIEAEKLLKKFKREVIRDVLDAMENKKDLLKKYDSVYLTINNWCKIAKPTTHNPGKENFPNFYSQEFINKQTDGKVISRYTQYLHSLGLKPVYKRGEVIDFK